MKVAVLAAGGHTGRLTVEALRARRVDVVPLTRRDADARDEGAVARAIAGCDAFVNLAGPFLANGLAPVRAAIRERVPYLDTTGEQAFMRDCHEALDAEAADASVPVVNAMAFEYALGDLAARANFPEGGETLHVLYRPRGASGSAGTKKTVLRVMSGPTLSYEEGRLVHIHAAQRAKTFPTADGPRTGVSFAGGEVLTVPRHTSFRTVRTYFATRSPTRDRLLAPLARVALHGFALRAAEAIVDRRHREPKNETARGEIHLLAEPGGRHVVVSTPDPYLTTGHIVAQAATRLADASVGGVLAPAEAFHAPSFLDALREALPGFRVATMSASSGARV